MVHNLACQFQLGNGILGLTIVHIVAKLIYLPIILFCTIVFAIAVSDCAKQVISDTFLTILLCHILLDVIWYFMIYIIWGFWYMTLVAVHNGEKDSRKIWRITMALVVLTCLINFITIGLAIFGWMVLRNDEMKNNTILHKEADIEGKEARECAIGMYRFFVVAHIKFIGTFVFSVLEILIPIIWIISTIRNCNCFCDVYQYDVVYFRGAGVSLPLSETELDIEKQKKKEQEVWTTQNIDKLVEQLNTDRKKRETLRQKRFGNTLADGCSICFQEYLDGEVVVILKLECDHTFHRDCFEKDLEEMKKNHWLYRHNVCPVCDGAILIIN